MNDYLMLMINQGWGHASLDPFFIWVSGRITFAAPMLAMLLAILYRCYGRDGAKLWGVLILMILVGDLIGNLLKSLFSQPRPCAVIFDIIRQPGKVDGISCGAMTTGMPSNHALNFFLTAIFISTIVRRWRWVLPLFIIATTVAISRVYLGVHYPSQIAAGAIIGILLGLLAALTGLKYAPFIQQIRNKQESQADDRVGQDRD